MKFKLTQKKKREVDFNNKLHMIMKKLAIFQRRIKNYFELLIPRHVPCF